MVGLSIECVGLNYLFFNCCCSASGKVKPFDIAAGIVDISVVDYVFFSETLD